MNVVVGVSGGIAAYKSCEIVRGLRKRGCSVRVAMTRAATRFVTPTTFQALSGNKVLLSLFDGDEAEIRHITLARDCRLLLVAPATANVIAKLATGMADDFLTTFALAVRCPILVAPAMNPRMWDHPTVTENVARLAARGCHIIGPDEGEMAEADFGVGRLAEPQSIVDRAMELLGSRRTLIGQTFLVTAGPTREPIDAVRFLSNASSGKMGFAIAAAAVRRGAEVVLVSGPTSIEDPDGVKVVRVTTAAEMRDAVVAALPDATIVIKAAAVSDFAAAAPSTHKVKKAGASRSIDFVPTPDILKEIAAAKGGRLVVGFAAETDDLLANARLKMVEKNLDFIVANHVGSGAGFGADDIEVVVLDREGREIRLGPAPKIDIAERLLDLIEERIAA